MDITQKKFKVTSSPHITDNATGSRIMSDVIIALIPALLAGAYFFGFYALIVVAVSVATCVLTEYAYNALLKKRNSIKDLSAVVTGLLLGLNLSTNVPLYIPVIGGVVAIVLVKMLFGGIGKNFANPAITARIFLLLCFSGTMMDFAAPNDYSGGFFAEFFRMGGRGVDAAASATPLSGGSAGLLDLFLGNISGSIGEVSALALLIGGAYLIIRRVIDYKIPLIITATVAAFAFIFSGDISAVLPELLSGGLLIGGIFMATDYSTSPNTAKGTIIYSLIIGIFIAVIREFSFMPDGVSYAILLGNIAVPLIDKYIYPRPFGFKEVKA